MQSRCASLAAVRGVALPSADDDGAPVKAAALVAPGPDVLALGMVLGGGSLAAAGKIADGIYGLRTELSPKPPKRTEPSARDSVRIPEGGGSAAAAGII